MYGLVNKGIHDFILKNYSEETWEQIKEKASLEIERFTTLQVYDDAITYQLALAISKVLKIEVDKVLEVYGGYWLEYASKQGYEHLIELSGKSFPDFLSNLDMLHSRLGYTYQELRPPSFKCIPLNDTELLLEYHSERKGLAPLVKGILFALSRKFHLESTIEHTKSREDSGYDEFLIRYVPIEVQYNQKVNQDKV